VLWVGERHSFRFVGGGVVPTTCASEKAAGKSFVTSELPSSSVDAFIQLLNDVFGGVNWFRSSRYSLPYAIFD